jgi:putative (di)nucleoside polyphosphate hydrolase
MAVLLRRPLPVSCGTLVMNTDGRILLCHVTDTRHWDIPKGMQDAGETPLQAAVRELQEEAGLCFELSTFCDLGCFDYRPDKQLHLFQVRAPETLQSLDHLHCDSYFADPRTGQQRPETDGFRWAARREIGTLCWPRMGRRLLALDW